MDTRLAWLRANWRHLFLGILIGNFVAGTIIVKIAEGSLGWGDAAFVHFSSFTTLGSDIPVNSTAGRTYVIIDAMLGLILIPTLSAVVAVRIAATDFRRSREKRHRTKYPAHIARQLADIDVQAFDVITDLLLSENERKAKRDELSRKAREIIASYERSREAS